MQSYENRLINDNIKDRKNILLRSVPLQSYSYRIDEYYACCTTKRLCPNDIDGLEFLRFYLFKNRGIWCCIL